MWTKLTFSPSSDYLAFLDHSWINYFWVHILTFWAPHFDIIVIDKKLSKNWLILNIFFIGDIWLIIIWIGYEFLQSVAILLSIVKYLQIIEEIKHHESCHPHIVFTVFFKLIEQWLISGFLILFPEYFSFCPRRKRFCHSNQRFW